MSKLSDYSKFDHLNDEDEEDEEVNSSVGAMSQNQATKSPESANKESKAQTRTDGPTQHIKESSKQSDISRFVVSFQGRPVYEWEQTLDSVTLFVPAPPFVKDAQSIVCHISAKHLQLGLLRHFDPITQQQKWYLDEDTYGTVDTHESCWSLEDTDDDDGNAAVKKVIVIYLTKAHLAETWEAALRGNRQLQQKEDDAPVTGAVSMDPMTKQEIQKQLLLERFQLEHPGMDFRGATFNGSAPDAKTFLGGIPYSTMYKK